MHLTIEMITCILRLDEMSFQQRVPLLLAVTCELYVHTVAIEYMFEYVYIVVTVGLLSDLVPKCCIWCL